ncbi:MAG: 2-phospho-L-lactate transferase [Alphaproteobacteria bacterium]
MSAKVLALCGGVGGAKLALGLAHEVAPEDLTVVVNTGDDFTHLGLRICPDIDTVTYTLSGLANKELGWGREDESWDFMDALKALGGEDWFNLGDRDLAIHVERTGRLSKGEKLSDITADFAKRLGIGPTIIPMTNDQVATIVDTEKGELAFQHYFVRDRCEPVVKKVRFAGAGDAKPCQAFQAALQAPELTAIIVCPSNPLLSVDPILALPGLRKMLEGHRVPVIAVSPIVGGKAIKGPTAKMMAELGHDVSAAGIVAHYGNLLDGFVVDEQDAEIAASLPVATHVTNTVMRTLEDRTSLARAVLDFARMLKR